MPHTEVQRLSKMLWEAREIADMYSDVVKARTGDDDPWCTRLRDEIDAYRAEKGWRPNGFGGEQA